MADRNADRTGWFPAFVVALSLSAFTTLVLPVQTFLANRSNYEFALSDLLWQNALGCVAATAALFAIAWLSDRFLRGWLSALLIAAREKSPTREESDRILSAERRTLRIYDKRRKTYTDYVHRPDGSVEEVKTW